MSYRQALVTFAQPKALMYHVKVMPVSDIQCKSDDKCQCQILMFLYVFKQLNSWITEKLQTAADDSFEDLQNLESQLKKHAAFSAEITVHQATINDVKIIGETLISNEHYASDDIAQRLEYLENRWQELLRSSSIKSQRLEEARHRVKFQQQAERLEMLIKDKVL